MSAAALHSTDVVGSWRPLTVIRDKLGNKQSLTWATGQDGFVNPRVLTLNDSTGRVLRFNYAAVSISTRPDAVKLQYFLKCIDFEGSCNQPLMTYAVSGAPSAPDFGELRWARDGKFSGNFYEYSTPLPPQAGYLSADNAHRLCGAACSPDRGGPGSNTCNQCDSALGFDLSYCFSSCQKGCSRSVGDPCGQLCDMLARGGFPSRSFDKQFAGRCEWCIKQCEAQCTTPNYDSCNRPAIERL